MHYLYIYIYIYLHIFVYMFMYVSNPSSWILNPLLAYITMRTEQAKLRAGYSMVDLDTTFALWLLNGEDESVHYIPYMGLKGLLSIGAIDC